MKYILEMEFNNVEMSVDDNLDSSDSDEEDRVDEVSSSSQEVVCNSHFIIIMIT